MFFEGIYALSLKLNLSTFSPADLMYSCPISICFPFICRHVYFGFILTDGYFLEYQFILSATIYI